MKTRLLTLLALSISTALLLALLCTLVVAAQGEGKEEARDSGPTQSPQAAGTWQATYRLALLGDLTTTNYWAHLDPESHIWNSYVLGNFTESLFGLSHQGLDFVPRLAADFASGPTQVGGFWILTVPLKHGVRWSDGTEFNAEDVAFTLQTCADLDLGRNWHSYCPDILDHVEATGPYTVTYYFTQTPGIGGWQAGVAMAPVLSKRYWGPIVEQAKTQPDPAAYLYDYVPHDEPVLGPFMFGEWVPGSHVEILPNPHYYFQGLQITEYANGAYQETLPGAYTFTAYGTPTGPVDLTFTVGPYVDSVRYTPFEDADAAYRALADGEVDSVLKPLPPDSDIRQMLEADPDITTVLNQEYGMRYMAFNMRKPVLNVRAFRQAVATLVDREFPGTIVPESSEPLYTFMIPANEFWYNPAVPHIGEGLTRQQRISETVDLLTSAGFTWTVQPTWDAGSQQVIPGQGLYYGGAPVPEFELLALTFDIDPLRATEALSIGQWLNEAGISVTVVLTDWGGIISPVFEDVTFDMYILGWGLGNNAFPDYFVHFWASWNDAAVGGFNTPGYNNPAYDALCNDFTFTNDLAQARADCFQMQEILATDLPYLTLHNSPAFDAYYHARVTFPYTKTLDGLQMNNGMPELVQIRVFTTTVGAGGGSLEVPPADTEISFPAGAVSGTVVVSFTVEPPSPAGDLVGAGHFFNLLAIYSDTGQPAQIEAGHGYTVVIAYDNVGPAIEDTLGLYWWDEGTGAWSQEGISSTVDTVANAVTAQVGHFSLFALLGETNRVYLPLVAKQD